MITIKTVELQEMVSRAVKGSSCNKLIPLTSLMKIQVKDGIFSLVTTDMSNYLYIKKKLIAEDFYAVVQTEQFSKLVSKMTSENISLVLDNSVLTVKGNGSYKIELPMDENGEMIKYPNPLAELKFEGEPTSTINLTTIKTILTANKAALATTLEVPVYTGYYVGDKVISTDTYKVCALNKNLFNKPVMISPETMNLLDVMIAEKINVDFSDDIILFTSEDCVLYSHQMEGIEEFAIEPISNLLNKSFENKCKISRNAILSTLDRIALFVGPYDNKSITLTFTNEGIDISSKKSDGVETIKYIESENQVPFTCNIDITMLIQQIKANATDTLEIYYGDDTLLKFVDNEVTQLIALLEDNE